MKTYDVHFHITLRLKSPSPETAEGTATTILNNLMQDALDCLAVVHTSVVKCWLKGENPDEK